MGRVANEDAFLSVGLQLLLFILLVELSDSKERASFEFDHTIRARGQ